MSLSAPVRDEMVLRECPFCGWVPDGALRTDRGHEFRHPKGGCALSSLWFMLDRWNTRTPASQVEAGEVEPTDEMIRAGIAAWPDEDAPAVDFHEPQVVVAIYRAMRAAQSHGKEGGE